MPKIKIPKSSPSIDMTPMVDLAFLLVTFFMLAASFRASEPVTVNTPSSISDKFIPENVIMVTIDHDGRVFFNLSGEEARREMLTNMLGKYKMKLSDEQIGKFTFMSTFGCTMQELPSYIDTGADDRITFQTKGIQVDTTENNELYDWINFASAAALNSAKTAFEKAKTDGENPVADDFKPKYILRVDSKAVYKRAETVINVFRDLNINNLNFITSSELAPIN